jgi:transposase-like protein
MGWYPKTLPELEKSFHDDASCRAYLEEIRWPDGFRCPACSHPEGLSIRRSLWRCKSCGKETSVTAGTIFQDSKLPLSVWFLGMWHVTSQKNGISALGLQRVLGLGSYRTAWLMLHKLRKAMVRPGRERLNGVVEVDETFWGASQAGPRGRGAESKALLAVAAEQVNGKGLKVGRIRLLQIPDACQSSLQHFLSHAVEPGSTIVTDGWSGYQGIEGYQHEVQVQSRKKRKDRTEEDLLPRVHLVISLLKRWLMGTHQGGVQDKHMDDYLNEFTFRFNRRTSGSRGLLFYRLVEQAVKIEPTTYQELANHNGWG